MGKIKVGKRVVVTASDEALRLNGCDERIKNGGIHKITGGGDELYCLDDMVLGLVHSDMIKLASPKWSIYTNDIPWCDLSDKQKGKLLLAGHAGLEFRLDGRGNPLQYPAFKGNTTVYKAVKPTPEPEPIEDIFIKDWFEQSKNVNMMISLGWTKTKPV